MEPVSFASSDELASRAASVWLLNWEGRRVAVPIFLHKVIIWNFGSATRQTLPELIWDAGMAPPP